METPHEPTPARAPSVRVSPAIRALGSIFGPQSPWGHNPPDGFATPPPVKRRNAKRAIRSTYVTVDVTGNTGDIIDATGNTGDIIDVTGNTGDIPTPSSGTSGVVSPCCPVNSVASTATSPRPTQASSLTGPSHVSSTTLEPWQRMQVEGSSLNENEGEENMVTTTTPSGAATTTPTENQATVDTRHPSSMTWFQPFQETQEEDSNPNENAGEENLAVATAPNENLSAEERQRQDMGSRAEQIRRTLVAQLDNPTPSQPQPQPPRAWPRILGRFRRSTIDAEAQRNQNPVARESGSESQETLIPGRDNRPHIQPPPGQRVWGNFRRASNLRRDEESDVDSRAPRPIPTSVKIISGFMIAAALVGIAMGIVRSVLHW